MSGVLAELCDLAERNHLSGRGDSERSLRAIHDSIAELLDVARKAKERLNYLNIKNGLKIDADLVCDLDAALTRCTTTPESN